MPLLVFATRDIVKDLINGNRCKIIRNLAIKITRTHQIDSSIKCIWAARRVINLPTKLSPYRMNRKRQQSLFECLFCALCAAEFLLLFVFGDFRETVIGRWVDKVSTIHRCNRTWSSISSTGDLRFVNAAKCLPRRPPKCWARLDRIYERMKMSYYANVTHGSDEGLWVGHNTNNNKRTINWN